MKNRSLLRRFDRLLTVCALLFLGLLVILVVPSFSAPAFELVNEASEPVTVVAQWRDGEQRVERLDAGASSRFAIDDEAAIRFTVHYASGRIVVTEPKYFTRGVTVIAAITDSGVTVRYDHER